MNGTLPSMTSEGPRIEDSLNKPVFLFAAGYRSGSTLLQRMITASGKVLVWGEAGGALHCLADAAERYAQMLGPSNRRFEHGYGGAGAESFSRFKTAETRGAHEWIGCINPSMNVIEEAFRKTLEAIYAEPAAELGYTRWGIKEVRDGIKTAVFLRRLYPLAKFLFLVRNPVDSLLSIKRRRWMDFPVIGQRDPLAHFARHWLKLAKEFREAGFGRLMRYEDLVSNPQMLTLLEEYLEISDIPRNFVAESHVDWKGNEWIGLTWAERLRVRLVLGDEMRRHGYAVRLGSSGRSAESGTQALMQV